MKARKGRRLCLGCSQRLAGLRSGAQEVHHFLHHSVDEVSPATSVAGSSAPSAKRLAARTSSRRRCAASTRSGGFKGSLMEASDLSRDVSKYRRELRVRFVAARIIDAGRRGIRTGQSRRGRRPSLGAQIRS